MLHTNFLKTKAPLPEIISRILYLCTHLSRLAVTHEFEQGILGQTDPKFIISPSTIPFASERVYHFLSRREKLICSRSYLHTNICAINTGTPDDFSPFMPNIAIRHEYCLCGTIRISHFLYSMRPEPLALLLSEDVQTFLILLSQDACTCLRFRGAPR